MRSLLRGEDCAHGGFHGKAPTKKERGLRRLLYNGFVLQVLPVTLGDMMTLDSWINEKVSKLDAVVQSAAAVTIPHALSVRIPRGGEFSRIWLPPVTNTL